MTIGELSRRFGLARSTLLYYDKRGLLSPSGRTAANYRIYTEKDAQRLEKICLYRKTGVELEKIRGLLDSPDNAVLEERLFQLNEEMNSIRIQQKMILEILENPEEGEIQNLFTAERFSSVLKSLGMTEKELFQFHVRMEMNSSIEHRSFLSFLGLSEAQADKIIDKTKKAIEITIEGRPD